MARRWTDEQRAVIEHDEGPAIVLAGAGSGKTTVVTERTARIDREGIVPVQRQLLVTFSRKAAEEMRQRLAGLVGEGAARRAAVTTFHALCFRLIRRHRAAFPHLRGEGDVTAMDEAEQKAVWREAAVRCGMMRGGKGTKAAGAGGAVEDGDREKAWVRHVAGCYSVLKNHGLWADPAGRHADALMERFQSRGFPPERAYRLCREYEALKAASGAVDFDDMCLLVAEWLERDAGMAERLARRYERIVVDESQDTNRVQYRIVRAVGRFHGNVLMVGDDDQAIYGWRGARVENLREFIEDFGAKTYPLQRNFRSTRAIVAAAARHIRHNRGRLEKNPYSEGEPGEPPRLVVHEDEREMGEAIADALARARRRGVPWEEMAVLYRINRLAMPVSDALTARRIPHRIVGGMTLLDRAPVKTALAAVRLLVNPRDALAFERVAKEAPGLGERSVAEIVARMREGDLSYAEAARTVSLRRPARRGVEWIMERLKRLEAYGPSRLGAWACGPEGLNLGKRAKDAPKLLERLDALYVPDRDDPWGPWLVVRLDADEHDEQGRREGVTLSTIHRAKGLEWTVVHVAAYSDGMMPLGGDEAEDKGEERRLSYVAITRARRECVLHHAKALMLPGWPAPRRMEVSPYVDELGIEVLAAMEAA